MSRYIDADELIRFFEPFKDVEIPVNALLGQIKDTLTIDVVEVVRCKDCKHLYKDGECPLRTWFTHDEDDFCSYGERKEK